MGQRKKKGDHRYNSIFRGGITMDGQVHHPPVVEKTYVYLANEKSGFFSSSILLFVMLTSIMDGDHAFPACPSSPLLPPPPPPSIHHELDWRRKESIATPLTGHKKREREAERKNKLPISPLSDLRRRFEALLYPPPPSSSSSSSSSSSFGGDTRSKEGGGGRERKDKKKEGIALFLSLPPPKKEEKAFPPSS